VTVKAAQLIDGSDPMTSDQLLAKLDAEGITHHTVDHAPMWTVDDAKAIRAPCDYGHTKNLFVRNKKGDMWLLCLYEDRRVDLKTVARHLGANRFSFASHERMMRYLGVIPGAVSVFSVLNDVTCKVQLFIDEILMDHPALHVHPLINTRTTTVDRQSLFDFLERSGHPPQILRFSGTE